MSILSDEPGTTPERATPHIQRVLAGWVEAQTFPVASTKPSTFFAAMNHSLRSSNRTGNSRGVCVLLAGWLASQCAIGLLLALGQSAMAQLTLTNLAGSTPGFADGAGAQAKFSSNITGFDIDSAGNVYVADAGNFRIRKITPDGIVSTLAGSGVSGTNDGPGLQAQFYAINASWGSLCVDGLGNCFVLDPIAPGRTLIRKIDPQGMVSTVYDEAVDPNDGADYASIVATEANNVDFVATKADTNGFFAIYSAKLEFQPSSALLQSPAFPSGWYQASFEYIGSVELFAIASGHSADVQSLHRDDFIDTSPTPGFSSTTWIGDVDWAYSTVSEAPLPYGFTTDVKGAIYIADNAGITRYTTNSVHLYDGVVGSLLAADTEQNIYFTRDSQILKLIASTERPIITSAPHDSIAVVGSRLVLRVSGDGPGPLKYQWQFKGTNVPGATNAALTIPFVRLSNAGDYKVTVSNSNGSVSASAHVSVLVPVELIPQPLAGSVGGFADGLGSKAQFSSSISGLDVDTAGNVYVADAGNLRIRKITPAGKVTTLAGSGNAGTNDGPGLQSKFASLSATWNSLCVDTLGNCYVLDSDNVNARIRKISPEGETTTMRVRGKSADGYPDYKAIAAMNSGSIAISSRETTTLPLPLGAPSDEILGLSAAGSERLLTSVAAYVSNSGGSVLGLASGHSSALFYLEDDWTLNQGNPLFVSSLRVTGSWPGGYVDNPYSTNGGAPFDPLGFTALPTGNAFLVGASGIQILWTNGVKATAFSGSGLNGLLAFDRQQNLYAVQGTRVIKLVSQPAVPVIIDGPADANVAVGDSVSFTVSAQGEPPLQVQWELNGTNISGATNIVLTLAHAQVTDAGTYTVNVSNAADTSSASATLQVRARTDTLFQSLLVCPAGQLSFVLNGPPALAFELQQSGDLVHWSPLQTFQNPSGHLEFSTVIGPTTNATFFRTKAVTGP